MLPCACKRCQPNRPSFKFPKTIINGQLQFLSVSQVETFDDTTPFGCQRKWGWNKIDGRKEPPSKSQEVGNEVHEQLQHYTSTGEDVLGSVARAGKHFVHRPGPGLLVEHEELGAVSVAGVPFYVRMDLLNTGEFWIDDEGEERPLTCPEVVDHKTSSDIGSWGKTGRELLGTTQMVVYGAYALRGGTASRVRLSHCYYGTKRRESLKSSAEVTRGEIDDRLGAIGQIVERMKVAASAKSGADLEPDYAKCSRCAHVPYCPRPASVQFQGIYALMGLTGGPSGPTLPDGGTEDMPSVLEKLKMQKSAPDAAPAPIPAPVGQVGVVVPAPAAPAIDQAAVNARVAELEAQLAAAKAGPNVTLTGEDARKFAPDIPAGAAVLTSAALAAAAGVLPPDAPVSGSVAPKADPIPPETLVTMSPEIQAAHAATFAPTLEQAHEASALGAPDAAAIMAAAEAANPASKIPDAPAKKTRAKKEASHEVVTYATSDVATVRPISGGIVVFVDSVVSGVETRSLDNYVDALLAKICESQKVIDVRVAEKGSPLAYGGWKGVIRAMAKDGPPDPGAYTLRVGSCEIRQEIAEGLQSVPGAIVARGVK